MAGVRFIWDVGWEQRVLSKAQARAVLHHAADAAKQSIEAAVPVRTGDYAAHFDLSLRVEQSGHDVRIVTGEPRWHIIEHGSVNNPPYNPISRGVESTGLRFERT